MRKLTLVLLSSLVWANAELAFLGIQPHLEPKFSHFLEKKIRQEIFDVTDSGLLPLRKTEGELWHFKSFPLDMNDGELQTMLAKIGARQAMVGELGRLTMSFSRTWWRPWRGDVQLRYLLKLQIFDGDNQRTLYLGDLESHATLKNVYLGKDPKITKLDAVHRHDRSVEMLDSLAAEVRKTLQNLLPLMKAQGESDETGGLPANFSDPPMNFPEKTGDAVTENPLEEEFTEEERAPENPPEEELPTEELPAEALEEERAPEDPAEEKLTPEELPAESPEEEPPSEPSQESEIEGEFEFDEI